MQDLLQKLIEIAMGIPLEIAKIVVARTLSSPLDFIRIRL